MISALIIDDEAHCRKALRQLVAAMPQPINIVAECSSAEEAKTALQEYKPDILFLDVEMPDKSGFDLLNELETIDFDIIFTTAYERYALQAIKSSALDFLLKPVTEKDLADAMLRYQSKQYKQQTLKQVAILLQNYGHADQPKKIAVPTNNGIEFLATQQIIRLEAESSYCIFFLANNTKLMVAKTLKDMEELLPAKQFYRVHHSHLVNIDCIKRFQKADGGSLVMEDGASVPVSRQRKEELLDCLKAR